MAPAVLSTGVFLSKAPFHRKFQRDPPEISVARVPSQPVNGNSRAAVTKKIDLTQKILFHNGPKCTTLSTNENLHVSPLKKRTVVFAPIWKTPDCSVQTCLDSSEIVQNENSGETEELPSVTVSQIIATSCVPVQSLVTHQRGNGFDRHQHPDISGNSERDGVEAMEKRSERDGVVLSPPESRNIREQVFCTKEPEKGPSGILIGPEFPPPAMYLQGTADPAEGSVANPQSLPVASDDAYNRTLTNHTHTDQSKRPRMNQQWSKSPIGIRNFDFRTIAKNLNLDGSISADTRTEYSRNEVVPAPEIRARSEGEIPTVVQEFSGRMDCKRRAKKRKNKQTMPRPGAAEKRAHLGPADPGETHRFSSLTQFTGGKITVGSRAPESCQGTNGQGTSNYSPSDLKSHFGRSDDSCDPFAELHAYSQSAYKSTGFADRPQCLNPAGGWKFIDQSPQDPIWYSASDLRSLVPYRPEGFNNHPHMKFKCVFCSQLFPCHDDLQGHVEQRHYGKDPYECPFCFKRFNHNLTYSGHLNEHVQRQDYPTFRCRACSACFSSEWEHDLHAVAH